MMASGMNVLCEVSAATLAIPHAHAVANAARSTMRVQVRVGRPIASISDECMRPRGSPCLGQVYTTTFHSPPDRPTIKKGTDRAVPLRAEGPITARYPRRRAKDSD